MNAPRRNGYPLRRAALACVFGAAALVLAWRAADLQLGAAQFLQEQGDARSLRTVTVAAHRGTITDRRGEPLAISTPVDSVWAQPRLLLDAPEQHPALARLLPLEVRQLRTYLEARVEREFVYLKRRVNPDLAERVTALNAPGVALQREYRRYYPAGEVTAQLLGFTGVDDTGQEGLELAFDHWLQGREGVKRVIKDRLGRVVADVESLRAPRPGRDLRLSVDKRIQYLVYRELKSALAEHRAQSGSAVVLDAHSGEVLAMVSLPAYNPNNLDEARGASLRNRAVTDSFEPGSTIKPFTIAAALEAGLYRADTPIDTAPGFFKVGGKDIRDLHNYGRLDLAGVIQKSSNVGAARIALSLPPERLWRTFSGAGLGQPTGSGFPGEAGGVLRPHQKWHKIERATLAFGYGLSVTLLQLAQAYSVLANDGVLKPVSFVSGARGEPRAVLAPATAQSVRAMMERVTGEGGTALLARVPGYRVAGKTGTVRKLERHGYSEDRYLSLFAGMAPASRPRLVIAVVINEPAGGHYYGGLVAAPVFAKVMAGSLRLLNVAPDDLASLKVAGLDTRMMARSVSGGGE